MSLKFKWLFLGTLAIIHLEFDMTTSSSSSSGSSSSTTEDEKEFAALRIDSPSSHVALSGDLTISIGKSNQTLEKTKYKHEFKEHRSYKNVSNEFFLLRVLYLLKDISELIGEIQLERMPLGNETVSITIPCGYFTRGGIYALRVEYKYKNSTVPVATHYQTSKILDVKWPLPTIFLEPKQITTYPNESVRATVKYDGLNCSPSENVPVAVYILQLIYCGSTVTACYLQNTTYTQILYYEDIKDILSSKSVSFRCELFGLPGTYAVRLRGTSGNPTAPNTSVYFKVNWSEEYKLTVHARSIYPCEGSGGGVPVLFEYPSCRLEGDRVRVYGRLKADVTSVASPSSLHYVTESRSIPGKHSLTFDCDLFTEKFVEYCFVYVSQAATGAMGDVKISCIPTFPFQSDAAGWGPWSPWSACSSSCFGGIRNRYRFCDTPPPKYGAKFCQGKAIETEFCGKLFWEDSENERGGGGGGSRVEDPKCRGAILAATKPEIIAEIGSQCRCGCRIALKDRSLRKILGANTQACPGRSFWLLQATETNFVIALHLDQLQFPCPGQYFRIRDGNSLNANLLVDVASDKMHRTVKTLISSGQNLLLEFFSDELTASGDACTGGFLAHAAVSDRKYLKTNGTTTVVPFETNTMNVGQKWILWKPAHLATALLLTLTFIVSIFLTLQFVIKYRKYRIAEDSDNFSDASELMPGRSRFLSTSTIISEVISMIETTTKVSRKESLSNAGEQYNSTETLTGYKDESVLSSSTLKLNNTMETSSDQTITSTKSTCDKLLSASSILVYNKPEVKYAYPVKLQTTEYGTSEEKVPSIDNEDAKDYVSKVCRGNEKTYSERKETSSESVLSSPSTVASGKETKERRNREKLLQDPGSDFSLTNPDSELELDYYDYNVANASAVPGSYLGMDPAFLVWIPPIDTVDDPLLSGSKRNSVLALETEGAALTPSEYQRMKLSSFEDFAFELEQRTKTFEKILPVQKLLEDSSIKVSSESISGILEHKQYRVISNRRRVRIGKDEESSEESNSSKSLLASPINMLGNDENNKALTSGTNKILQREYSKQSSDRTKIRSDNQDEDSNVSYKYKELTKCAQQSFASVKDAVNIPMTELSGSPLKNFAQGRKLRCKDIDPLNIPGNPDYGIETFCVNQGTFYDQNIRFVDDDDDDDDEYID